MSRAHAAVSGTFRVVGMLFIAGVVAISGFVAGCAKHEHDDASGKPGVNAKTAKYYCPMHPTYTSDKPGVCPICNMKLVPMEPAAAASTVTRDPKAMKPTDAQTVCLRHECPMIKAGENCPMLIVSESGETPECPVCQKRIDESEMTPVRVLSGQPEGYAVIALSPGKRQLIGVKTAKIEERPLQTSLRTSGLALASPQMNLFIYESDMPRINQDSVVKAYFPAVGREFLGQVSRIPWSLDRDAAISSFGPGAVLDTASSQITLRARLDDPERQLRRGMSADVEVVTDLGRRTALPEEAVFFTGQRTLVFVEKAEGVYEPREVKLGVKAGGYYAVESGLDKDEMVVTSGNFLIDSESRLRSAMEGASADAVQESHAH